MPPCECLHVIKNILFLGVLLHWVKELLSSYLSGRTCLSRINMKNPTYLFFSFPYKHTLSAYRINDRHISTGLLFCLDWLLSSPSAASYRQQKRVPLPGQWACWNALCWLLLVRLSWPQQGDWKLWKTTLPFIITSARDTCWYATNTYHILKSEKIYLYTFPSFSMKSYQLPWHLLAKLRLNTYMNMMRKIS